MTTELLVLLVIFVLVIGAAILGPNGPGQSFRNSGPRLGARLEYHITIGDQFTFDQGTRPDWQRPNQPPPLGNPQ